YGLSVADNPDSQDICFVPNGDYAAVIEKLRPGSAEPGEIVDLAGNVVGQHRGVIHYTIGQRRGLGIGVLEDPIYVVKLDPELRRVIVGPKEALSTRTIPVREINWLGDRSFDSREEWQVLVKVRSTRPPRPAVIRPISATEAEVELLSPEDGISAGQACVFYEVEGSRVLGGGWIWKGRA
ncbi:MAG: tRNA methyl transferase PRC-barrel domain-containing protein, partial [Paracoccaceae bacterium]